MHTRRIFYHNLMYIADVFARALKPPSKQPTSEWLEENLFLPNEGSPEPGKYRLTRTPYLKEIFDIIDDPEVYQVTLMCSTQLGKSQTGINYLLKQIETNPGPMMLLLPNEKMVKSMLTDRFLKTIRDSPGLSRLLKRSTQLQINFPGGAIYGISAKSVANLRSRPIKYIFADEVDGFEFSPEGDILELAKKRQQNYIGSKLIVMSTPVLQESSIVYREFLKGDRRYYYVPCPKCDELFTFEMSLFKYETEKLPTGALNVIKKSIYCECPYCGHHISEDHKPSMIRNGIWRSESNLSFNGHASFYLNQFYSLLAANGWYGILQAYEDCMHKNTMQTFQNTYLGLPYTQATQQPDSVRLYERRKNYPIGTVPSEAAILTAGVDVQGDRIEVLVEAWGKKFNSYAVDYKIIPCDTGDSVQLKKALETALNTQFPSSDGRKIFQIKKMCVDYGYKSSVVAEATSELPKDRVVLVKGNPGRTDILQAPKPVNFQAKKLSNAAGRVWLLGVDKLKEEIYGQLRLGPSEDGTPVYGYKYYPEFPMSFFKGLTIEVFQEQRDRQGMIRYVWTNPSHGRNEPLDTSCYSKAAAYMLGLNNMTDNEWDNIFNTLKISEEKVVNVHTGPKWKVVSTDRFKK